MLNVIINPILVPSLKKNGFFLELSEEIKIRNFKGELLVEVIYDERTGQNIVLTRENVHYTKMVSISLEKGILKLHCRKSKQETRTISISYNGKESIC